MKHKMSRKSQATETLDIIRDGFYKTDNHKIDIKKELDQCLEGTELFTPDYKHNTENTPQVDTKIIVENCTTLEACKALYEQEKDIFCLNFASAKNPGGGFMGGAQAQEESLARSSALYPSLISQPKMYEENRKNTSCIYLDYMIYSPKVPVFRDDRGALLDEPYLITFLTSPAVNAGAVKRNEPENTAMILPKMKERIDSVLSVAKEKGHKTLVLGAWGCGVFQNDAKEVASLFHDALNSKFKNTFSVVYMAVLDSRNRGIFDAFDKQFKH